VNSRDAYLGTLLIRKEALPQLADAPMEFGEIDGTRSGLTSMTDPFGGIAFAAQSGPLRDSPGCVTSVTT
jgi:hypothetical protein